MRTYLHTIGKALVFGSTVFQPDYQTLRADDINQTVANKLESKISQDLDSEETEKLVLKEDFLITDEVIRTAINNLNTKFAMVASNPMYVLGRNIQPDIDIALANPSTIFAKSLFSNSSYYLTKDEAQLAATEKYIDTPLAKIIAERADFPINDDHMKACEEKPETLFAQGLDNNLNHRVNIGKPTYVTDASFEQKVLKASKEMPVLIDFWKPWCSPCVHLNSTLDEIAKKYEGKARVVKVNIDQDDKGNYINSRIMAQDAYKEAVSNGIPELIIIRDGFIQMERPYHFTNEELKKIDGFSDEQFFAYVKDKISSTLDKYIKAE